MGEKDPFVGPFKDLDAHFIFQFLYGFRKAWLGDEEGLGSAAQGTLCRKPLTANDYGFCQ